MPEIGEKQMSKLRNFGGNPFRFAIIIKETGEVSSTASMSDAGSAPWLDRGLEATHELIRGVPGYVVPGMLLKGDEFVYREGSWEARNGKHPARVNA